MDIIWQADLFTLMKTTLIAFSVAAAGLWGGISIGYHHGYARGSSDELSRWRIETVNDEPFPNTTMVGTRELWIYSDGSRVPPARTVRGIYDKNINSIPDSVFP
jgi:hypothetical protein